MKQAMMMGALAAFAQVSINQYVISKFITVITDKSLCTTLGRYHTCQTCLSRIRKYYNIIVRHFSHDEVATSPLFPIAKCAWRMNVIGIFVFVYSILMNILLVEKCQHRQTAHSGRQTLVQS